MTFTDKIYSVIEKTNSLLCVGLDPVIEKIPPQFQQSDEPLFAFSKYIIDQTHGSVMGYKPNSAFFEAYGSAGIDQLQKTCAYIRSVNPELVIILDAKRGDIGNTNEAYIRFAYEYLDTDAITLHPYLGKEAIAPFLSRADKGAIILCRTSNPGAGEFQDTIVNTPHPSGSLPSRGELLKNPPLREVPQAEGVSLFRHVATQVSQNWNEHKNCMLVVGATYPEELAEVRSIIASIPILVPGIGVQGGDLEKTLKAGLTQDKSGLIITVSRSVIYAENPGEEAERMKEEINRKRQ